MSIRVVCPNGHSLKVQDNLAGRTGLCPVCKAKVKVPRPSDRDLSEDAILGILGPQETEEAEPQGPADKEGPKPPAEGPASPKKKCEHCNREIPANLHVCPFCHTYIASLAEL